MRKYKIINYTFIILFLLIIFLPLLTTNLKDDVISQAENRYLAPKASLYNENGEFNTGYVQDFETWFEDNIGFRDKFVLQNAWIQYYIFNLLANKSDNYLGPRGEFNYATDKILIDYQHNNMYSQEVLDQLAVSMQYINDYIERNGATLYYFQCWDKHEIYPEYFPDAVIQHGNISKTDEIVRTLIENTSINVISPKEMLIASKDKYDVYSKFGDPTHWTQRGAWLGYNLLIDEINEHSEIEYRKLNEENYNLDITDQGITLFGGIHRTEMLESFSIINPQAQKVDELTLYSDDERNDYYRNDHANNRIRVLILGDSYFDSFIIDDLAESFYETILIRNDYIRDIKAILDEYDADIVIMEHAERVDRTMTIIDTVNNWRTLEEQP